MWARRNSKYFGCRGRQCPVFIDPLRHRIAQLMQQVPIGNAK